MFASIGRIVYGIYNRALSVAEVLQLYNSGKAVINNSTPTGNLASGLVGYWTFDGKNMKPNVLDSSGNGNNGNLTGATTTVPGKFGQALNFDGSIPNNIVVNNSSSLNITGNSMSISMWVNHNGYPGAFKGLLWKSNSGGSVGYLAYTYSVGNFQFIINNTLSGDSGTVWDGRWHMITGIYDGSHVSIYKDWVYITQGVATGNIPDSSGYSLNIGSADGTATYAYTGLIDDVRIYSRVLSASEILQLYNLGRTKVKP